MAYGVIKAEMNRGDLKAGDRICEYTGGSTGRSIAFVASIPGLNFRAVSSSAFSAAKLQAIRSYGAQVVLVESSDGKLNPELFRRMKYKVQEIAVSEGSFYFDQLVHLMFAQVMLQLGQRFRGKSAAMLMHIVLQ